MKKILIAGYGRSGKAAVKLADVLGFDVWVADEKPLEISKPFLLFQEGLTFPDVDAVILSPGIHPAGAFGRWLLSGGVPVISELAFGASHSPVPVLAITGTNGKTTATELTTHILNALGVKAESTGNIGNALAGAAADAIAKITSPDVFVTEVSSFQLEQAQNFVPRAAVLLNITSDHIDRYASFEDYAQTKYSIFASGTAAALRADLKKIPSAVTFSATASADWTFEKPFICRRGKKIVDFSRTALQGAHNVENLMAALILVNAFLPDFDSRLTEIQLAADSFRLSAHRIETIAEVKDKRFINDSKATNPDAVLAALSLAGGQGNVRLLLGGLDKDMDFSLLNHGRHHIAKGYIYGSCAKRIADAVHFPHEVFGPFDEAFNAAYDELNSGEVLLLSPACASMDQFKDYAHRGETFRSLVLRRLHEDNPLPSCPN